MNIDSTLGKYALVVLILGGFIYPTAAGIIKADSEPIGVTAVMPAVAFAESALIAAPKSPKTSMAMVAPTSKALSAVSVTLSNAPAVATRVVHITAYSSTPEETDDTPFITAMGSTVRDGIIATNQLPFGTKVRIPDLFGQKVFVVEDRMHPRMTNNVDIWMNSKSAALNFGVANAKIEILD